MHDRTGIPVVVAAPPRDGRAAAAAAADIVEDPPAAVYVDRAVVGQADGIAVDQTLIAVAGVFRVLPLVQSGGAEDECGERSGSEHGGGED